MVYYGIVVSFLCGHLYLEKKRKLFKREKKNAYFIYITVNFPFAPVFDYRCTFIYRHVHQKARLYGTNTDLTNFLVICFYGKTS